MLRVDGLSKRYGDVLALQDLCFEVQPGQVFALLGASGSGKTTALRIAAGLVKPDAGSVHLGDDDLSDWPPERRRMGVVFQEYALFEHLDVGRNVAFGLKSESPASRVAELLDLVGLSGLEGRGVRELSGGQRQRVALARALARDPDALLLDEPFSGLDVALRFELRHELARIVRSAGCATLLITHDRDDVFALADQVAVLQNGVCLQQGLLPEVHNQPKTRAVAHALGPANLIAVKSRDGAIVTTVCGQHEISGGNGDWLMSRPSAVHVVAGDIATATNCRFAGAAFEVELEVEGQRLWATSETPVVPGVSVGLRIDDAILVGD